MDHERMLSLREFGKIIGRHPRTIRRWLGDDRIREVLGAIKVPGRFGGEWRIPESAVDRLSEIVEEMRGAEEIEFQTCAGVNKRGEPCGAPAVEGSRFCRWHQGQDSET